MLETSPRQDSQALFSARALVRCDFAVEQCLRSLRAAPSAALAAVASSLFRRQPLDEALSSRVRISVDHLLLDANILAQMEVARAKGQRPTLSPDLPDAWLTALAEHLDADIAPQTSAFESRQRRTPVLHRIREIARLMRVNQWPKNVLVFLPLLLAHRFTEWPLIGESMVAFFAFSLAASTIYVLNDMMDIASDRKHPTKRLRPFASGALPARWGLAVALLSLAGALGLTLMAPAMFAVTILAYVAVNIAYTFYLKRKLLLDVLALAGSYTLRILAGNAATGIELSFWLLAFSVFLFFSLALVKRYVEMDKVGMNLREERRVMGRGYRYVDLEMLSQMGVASAFAAVLVLALYVERAGSTGLYTHPELIWIICPVVLYVISRIWFLAKRGEMKDDPVAFIMNDWRSHLMGAAVVAIMAAASW